MKLKDLIIKESENFAPLVDVYEDDNIGYCIMCNVSLELAKESYPRAVNMDEFDAFNEFWEGK